MARRPATEDPRSKLTDQRMQAILIALEHGCTRRAAAGAADVSHATFYRWMDADATLRDAVEKAENRAEASFTAVITGAVATTWQAAAWWLERRKWQDYGRHERVDVTVDATAIAERIASDYGLDATEIMAEAERALAGK